MDPSGIDADSRFRSMSWISIAPDGFLTGGRARSMHRDLEQAGLGPFCGVFGLFVVVVVVVV